MAKISWRVLCNLLLAEEYIPVFQSGQMFKITWMLSTESAVMFERSIEKIKDGKRGKSWKLLINWDSE